MERGKRIHKQAELYMKGEAELPATAIWKPWRNDMQAMRNGGYEAEKDFAFTVKWEPCSWFGPTAWARMRVDVISPFKGGVIDVVDYKTGQLPRDDSHKEQAELYAIAGWFYTKKKAEEIAMVYLYLDQVDAIQHDFTGADMPALVDKWEKRAAPMLEDEEFKPTPSRASCNAYGGCDFAANKGGQCQYTTAGVLKAGSKKGDVPELPKAKPSKWNRGGG